MTQRTVIVHTLSALLLLATLPVSQTSIASTNCKDDSICIDEIRRGPIVELRARNLRNYPITFTLNVQSQSYSAAGDETVTRTLGPQQSAIAMKLLHRDGARQADYDVQFDWTVGDRDANHDDDYLYAFPYEQGRSYRIVQGYGSRFSHRGLEEYAIDFDMDEGTPVHAARGGVVARVEERHDKGCWTSGCGQYANYIVILHDDGTTGEYYHLQKDGAFVAVGASVARGDRIGLSGNTGYSALPHLHFAVYRATTWGDTQSIPIRFQSADGVISRPRRGGLHQAAH